MEILAQNRGECQTIVFETISYSTAWSPLLGLKSVITFQNASPLENGDSIQFPTTRDMCETCVYENLYPLHKGGVDVDFDGPWLSEMLALRGESPQIRKSKWLILSWLLNATNPDPLIWSVFIFNPTGTVNNHIGTLGNLSSRPLYQAHPNSTATPLGEVLQPPFAKHVWGPLAPQLGLFVNFLRSKHPQEKRPKCLT